MMPEDSTRSGRQRVCTCWLRPPMKPWPVGSWPPPMTLPDRSAATKSGSFRGWPSGRVHGDPHELGFQPPAHPGRSQLRLARPALHDHQTTPTRETRMSGTTENLAGATAIRPFRIEVPEEDLVELRRRIAATRWPSKELVDDRSQGGPLTDPTAHGGTPGDAFHLVLPSLPGYGFSGEPTELGWDADRIARAWVELMDRLGYTRYVAQGGDVGAYVTDAMGRQAPEGLLGIHLNVLTAAVGLKDQLPAESEQERAAHDALTTFLTDGFAIVLEQSTRPQTIGYSLLDSPVGLAAWMLDHDTDSYYKISRAFVDSEPAGNLTRDNIVDDITLYWLTGTGASAARWYWEFGRAQAAAGAAGQAPPPVAVPVGYTNFPGEVFPAPRSWVEVVFPGLAYFNEPDKGGHFAAWEEPELFSTEVRATFSSLRE